MSSVDIVFPNIGVRYDGIADYTEALAAEFANLGHDVRLLGALDPPIETLAAYVQAWPTGLGVNDSLVRAVAERDPASVIFQLEQFSYGRRGWNPVFSHVIRDLRRAGWKGTAVVLAHETYPAADTLGHFAMKIYQKRQAARIVRDSDLAVFTCHQGLLQLGQFARKACVLPVPSNIARIGYERNGSRALFGWRETDVVVAIFGAIGDSSLLRRVTASVAGESRVRFIYIGKDGHRAREVLGATRLEQLGALSASDVSRRLSAADIGLVLPPDGISGRRGSFAAMALHGLAIIASKGRYTDPYLRDAAASGQFCLVPTDDPNVETALLSLVRNRDRRIAMSKSVQQSALARSSRDNALELLQHIGNV